MATSSAPYLALSLKDQGYTGATGTTPYRPATPDQVGTLQEQYSHSFTSSAPVVVPRKTVVLSFNFDGTQNNGAFPAPGESPTNVHERCVWYGWCDGLAGRLVNWLHPSQDQGAKAQLLSKLGTFGRTQANRATTRRLCLFLLSAFARTLDPPAA